MPAKKRCFVISPIGDEDSEIRKEANALLWIAQKALERYDFEVIRVDQIPRATVITNEIIQLIQEAELCLIVLTGHNPNVFYEAGRRHETGRPFIQLIRKGESIPFDVASIRTIIYDDVQSLPSAAKLVEQIEKFVQEFEKSGYGAAGTGVSLSTIASAIDRIERKVGQIMGSAPLSAAAPTPVEEIGIDLLRKNPRELYLAAVARGDLQRASALLPRLEQLMGPSHELIAAAGVLAVQGYEPALEVIYRTVTDHFDKILSEGIDGLQAAISAMVQFYGVTDRESEGIERIGNLITKVADLPGISDTAKAHVLNQLQRLYYGAGRYEDALAVCEKVLQLDPNDPSYIFNASLVYEKVGLKQKAVEMVDRYMKIEDVDEDHLSHAVELYTEVGRLDDANLALQKLRQVSPDKAAILEFGSKISRKLTGRS